MKRIIFLFTLLVFILTACGGNAPTVISRNEFSVTAKENTVEILIEDERAQLALETPEIFEKGTGVDVSEEGRALVTFGDLIELEIVRNGELIVQEVDINEQKADIRVLQNGGALVSNIDPDTTIEKRFSIQTEFAEIVATGTEFLVVRETGTPLEWIVALDAHGNALEVTAEGVTKDIQTGGTRWVAPFGEPSAGIQADMNNVNAWIKDVQSGVTPEDFGQIVWGPADQVTNAGTLDALPLPGESFTLDGVELTLQAGGNYELLDCNTDGANDIRIINGGLEMDFRLVTQRVQALDITIYTPDAPTGSELTTRNPANEPLSTQALELETGKLAAFGLREDQPIHFADLYVGDGCFLGFSLTPPQPDGTPAQPRPTTSTTPAPVESPVVDIQSPTSNDGLTNGVLVRGVATVPFERNLVLRVETLDGTLLVEEGLFVYGGDYGGDMGVFSATISLNEEFLPLDIRVTVENISAKDGSVLASDSIEIYQLLPEIDTGLLGEPSFRRPPDYGEFYAMRASEFLTPITVDGGREEWDFLADLNGLDPVPLRFIVYNPACEVYAPDSTRNFNIDLEAYVDVAYSDTFLFFYFSVFDETYAPYEGRDDFVFLGDAPQILLDINLGGDYGSEKSNADDVQFDFFPGEPIDDLTLGLPRVIRWDIATLTSANEPEADIVTEFQEGGYVVEAAIPWETLGVVPTPGMTFGMVASVSDNDSPGANEQQCMISSSPVRDFNNPRTWGTLELLPDITAYAPQPLAQTQP